MQSIEELIEIEAIRLLKARYFRLLDTKDWGGWVDLFAPDAQMNLEEVGDAVIISGAVAIVDFVQAAIDPMITCHHGHMSEIEIISPTAATGIWAMEDILQGPPGGLFTSLHGWGHYHETYTKFDDGWRFQTLRLTRLRVDRE